MRFLMAIGLPGSGKSTYGLSLDDTYVVVSSDAIREELYGNVEDNKHNDRTYDTMLKRSVAALNEGKNVYFDACNVWSKKRVNMLREIRHRLTVKATFDCLVFAIPFEYCKHNNLSRDRVVPEYAMIRMYKAFQSPHNIEGWDNIYVHNGNKKANKAFIDNILKESVSLPHDNPHHQMSVGEHMASAYAQWQKDPECFDDVVGETTKYHDVGKPFCKVFTNAKGEPSDIAHFYNHENVGAYLYLVTCPRGKLNDRDMEIASLINHHMDFFRGEEYVEKIRKRYGEVFFKKLSLVHKYDLLAH